jgi:hypothetical protein
VKYIHLFPSSNENCLVCLKKAKKENKRKKKLCIVLLFTPLEHFKVKFIIKLMMYSI